MTDKKQRRLVVIAHNLQSYDGYFIIREMYRDGKQLTQIRNGAKIMELEHYDIKFIDSRNFFAMLLKAFPSTFGLKYTDADGNEDFYAKGYFPHLFNRRENEDYVGPLPPKCDYMPQTVASEPAYGWNGQLGNQSNEAMEWLLWTEHCKKEEYTDAEREWDDDLKVPMEQRTFYIQHAGNGGEKTIQYIKGTVDGYCETTKTVYEYQGCFYHGCENCYPNRTERHTRLDNRQMWEVHEVTKEKVAKLKSLGLNVVEMWGCQWQQYKKDHPDCATFVKNLNLTERLNPRDAFFGGRTNAAKLYHRCNNHEKIQYYDFTSLYPWVNKYKTYPIQHPRVYLNPRNQDINAYFGVAKCRVHASRNLYHPVLPVRVNGKLLFPLCVKCAEIQLDQPLLERTCSSLQSRRFCGANDSKTAITNDRPPF